ncbi:MAG: RDD family protein [Acidobacteria bacterium]|nr:MAG: RDD family protein [Acidobacteriota bacterium]
MHEARLEIRTPEGVLFAYPLAGLFSRMLAWLIDLFCVSALTSLFTVPLSLLRLVSPDWSYALGLLIAFVLQIGYSIVLEWHWRGQTIGKKLLRLRVIDTQGLRLQPQQIVIRNLLRTVDQLPLFYMVGAIAVLASRKYQRLGDWAANTVVTRVATLVEPDLDLVASSRYNSLTAYPHLVARLVQSVSAREAWVALEAIRRRDRMKAEARLELFARLADHFRSAVPFPAEAWAGISDEQYVRNVMDAIFRRRVKG